MPKNCTSRNAWTLVAGFGCLCAVALIPAALIPAARADSDNPAVTCHGSVAGGVDQDICVGKPGAAAGVTPRDVYPWVVPRLRFGVGIGD